MTFLIIVLVLFSLFILFFPIHFMTIIAYTAVFLLITWVLINLTPLLVLFFGFLWILDKQEKGH